MDEHQWNTCKEGSVLLQWIDHELTKNPRPSFFGIRELALLCILHWRWVYQDPHSTSIFSVVARYWSGSIDGKTYRAESKKLGDNPNQYGLQRGDRWPLQHGLTAAKMRDELARFIKNHLDGIGNPSLQDQRGIRTVIANPFTLHKYLKKTPSPHTKAIALEILSDARRNHEQTNVAVPDDQTITTANLVGILADAMLDDGFPPCFAGTLGTAENAGVSGDAGDPVLDPLTDWRVRVMAGWYGVGKIGEKLGP